MPSARIAITALASDGTGLPTLLASRNCTVGTATGGVSSGRSTVFFAKPKCSGDLILPKWGHVAHLVLPALLMAEHVGHPTASCSSSTRAYFASVSPSE